MGHHTTKYYITNYLTLNWPSRCLLILYKIKVLFYYYWLKVKFGEKKSLARLLLHFHTSILPIIEGFRDIFHPESEFVSFFSPYLRPFKARPPAGVPANYRSLLSPPFFLISRSSEGGFFKEITSHFTSQAEQKLPSNKRLLLTACGRSWQHCWTLGFSTGLQKTPPAAAASDLTRHHSDISSNQSCRREDKMFHNNRGVFFLWMEDCVKSSAGLTVMNEKEVKPKHNSTPKPPRSAFC